MRAGGIRILDPVLFQIAQFQERLLHCRALPRILPPYIIIGRLQHARFRQGEQASVIRPVVQAVEITEGHIHVGCIIADLASPPEALGPRMSDTRLLPDSLFRLIERLQQQDQKRHVVIQRQS